MGYETKIIIGKSTTPTPEWEEDKEHPFDDGSGFPYKMDKLGREIPTGRMETYFSVYAELDLCKLGYQDDELNRLAQKSHDKAKGKQFWFFYGTDGNTRITEDSYGAGMTPMPIGKVLKAMKASIDKDDPYRRLAWAIALLESMAKDSEGLEVLFYGH